MATDKEAAVLQKYEPFLVQSKNFGYRPPLLFLTPFRLGALEPCNVRRSVAAPSRGRFLSLNMYTLLSRDKLFCALTCQLMTKSVKGVRKHMKGHHFQAAKGATPVPPSSNPKSPSIHRQWINASRTEHVFTA